MMQRTVMEEQALRHFALPSLIPDQTCFFAGQKLTRKNTEGVRKRLPGEIKRLIRKGVDTFISGGSPGFELDAEGQVLALKTQYPTLRLFFVLPYPHYTETWEAPAEAERLRQLLAQSDAHMYAAERIGRGRNRIICMAYYAAHALCALQSDRLSPAAQAAFYAVRGGSQVKNLVEGSTLLQNFIERETAFRRAAEARKP